MRTPSLSSLSSLVASLALSLPCAVTVACAEPGDDGGDEGEGDEGEGEEGEGDACLSDAQRATLQAHVGHVDASIGLLVTHPGPREAVSFLDVPGFEGTIQYYSLIAECADASSYEEYCDPESKLCSQIECTGEGAGWIVHQRNDGTLTAGDFTFTSLTADLAWEDGSAGFTWTIAATATGPGDDDWSVSGTGEVAPDGDSFTWTLHEELPSLLAAGAVKLDVVHGGTDGGGTITLDDATIADVGAELAVTAAGDCS